MTTHTPITSASPFASTAFATDDMSVSLSSNATPGDLPTTLTPDALMTYCQSQLGSIDSQMQSSFGKQSVHANEVKEIQTVLNQFQSYQGGTSDPSECASLEKSLGDLINKIKSGDPGCPELADLTKTYSKLVWSGTGTPPSGLTQPIDTSACPANSTDDGPVGDNNLGGPEMTSYVGDLQNSISDLNSSASLQMIQLQSLMSQRQTALSLTTNLVQALGDQSSKIADNIGH